MAAFTVFAVLVYVIVFACVLGVVEHHRVLAEDPLMRLERVLLIIFVDIVCSIEADVSNFIFK